ncbi:MAG TPA: hypothetical protein VNG69_17505 [Casimicrobiaceae bacterium]|nr:hypothetical protein [Casimicrobiaceae bacterium]
MLYRWLGALGVALVSSSVLADSISGPVTLAPSADCQTAADVQWSFSYTVNPAREFGTLTNPSGTVIGSYSRPSPLAGGTFSGTWQQPITLPQPPNTLIGSYGGAGDSPASAANTAEFFVLYNCTTRQVIFRCSGNLGSCPTTALQGIARVSENIPATSTIGIAALLTLLLVSGFALLRPVTRRRA